MAVPVALTIAGSDSSGSSGIQGDLPTFAALGVHGVCVLTLVTAQNSTGVQAFHQLPDDLVAAQLDAVVDDLAPAATKTGLLRTATAVQLVNQSRSELGHLVVDPVLVDSSGSLIVDAGVVDGYRDLCRGAVAITPNRAELELLLGGVHLNGVETIEDRATDIRSLGASIAVVTGGRGTGREVIDVVVTPTGTWRLTSPRKGTGAIRGTGCTFSAALTAGLAAGRDPEQAARLAHEFVQEQLRRTDALSIGAGRQGLPHIVARDRTS